MAVSAESHRRVVQQDHRWSSDCEWWVQQEWLQQGRNLAHLLSTINISPCSFLSIICHFSFFLLPSKPDFNYQEYRVGHISRGWASALNARPWGSVPSSTKCGPNHLEKNVKNPRTESALCPCICPESHGYQKTFNIASWNASVKGATKQSRKSNRL